MIPGASYNVCAMCYVRCTNFDQTYITYVYVCTYFIENAKIKIQPRRWVGWTYFRILYFVFCILLLITDIKDLLICTNERGRRKEEGRRRGEWGVGDDFDGLTRYEIFSTAWKGVVFLIESKIWQNDFDGPTRYEIFSTAWKGVCFY